VTGGTGDFPTAHPAVSGWADARGDVKDEVLDRLADRFNVAQFVSFGPGPEPTLRHCRIAGVPVTQPPSGARAALVTLLTRAVAGTVNVRTFRPGSPKGNPFHYGLRTADEAEALVRSHAAVGYHVIVNETIDVDDGGVSGVRAAGVTEFAPHGTPRVVEEEGVCSLDDRTADAVFAAVYGVVLPFPDDEGLRIEFSIHPRPVGFRRERWVVWEVGPAPARRLEPHLRWPNRFSRHLGDKAFGLLLASVAGIDVPDTVVLARDVAPFRFGKATGTGDHWLRTCPRQFDPGRFPTVHGWTDPFRLLAEADPEGDQIASVLVQEGVSASWSGAARSAGDRPVVEGVRGQGDRFMLGLEQPTALPPGVDRALAAVIARVEARFGPVRLEWVADPTRVWIVQLNQQRPAAPATVVAGRPDQWIAYDPDSGLEALAVVVDRARAAGAGTSSPGRWD
jgi:hypothetical protein